MKSRDKLKIKIEESNDQHQVEHLIKIMKMKRHSIGWSW